jgi:hypothetical protein
MRRTSALADAHQANRDLRNQISSLEHPLRERIRALEAQNGQLRARADRLHQENAVFRQAVQGLLALLNHTFASGKIE